MSQLHLFPFLLLTIAQIFVAALADMEDQVLVVQNSTSMYDNLCQNFSTPIKSETFTLKILGETNTWYHIMGDDVARQYFGSLLKGVQLSKDDAKDYEGMCFEVNKPVAQLGNVGISSHNAFGKHATDVYRVENTDAENVYVIVGCFSNNEVGWKSLSQSPTLTMDENTAVIKQIVALGFDSKNTVQMYDETCKNI